MNARTLFDGAQTEKGRREYAAGAFLLLVVSLVMGMTRIPGSPIPQVLWVAFGCASVVLIWMAFPDVWNYLFWLVVIYCFGFLGFLCFTALPELATLLFGGYYRFFIILTGLLLETLALWAYVRLVLHVKSIRDEVAGITTKSAASSRLRQEAFERARYVPLGLWSLSAALFFLLSNASAAGWYIWASGRGSLALYIASELLLMMMVIYMLWTIQTRFSWGERPEVMPSLGQLIPLRPSEAALRKAAPARCPACNVPGNVERRMCRACGKPRDFYWCTRSEHYLILCPACRRYSTFGRDDCAHCGATLPRAFACPCGARHPPGRWPRAAA